MNRIWKFGVDVDTDQMVPGRFAPYMTSQSDLAKAAFIEARPEFAKEVKRGDVIVAGNNFGCGSSREYAPEALKLAGVAAIFSPRFACIFQRNALNLGIPTFELDLTWLEDGAAARLELEGLRLVTEQGEIALPEPAAFVREVWEAGGVVPFYREHRRFPGEAPLAEVAGACAETRA